MKRSRWRVRLAMLAGGATMFGSCNGTAGLEFRSVAGQGLQQGVTTIVDSVIDGLFAVFDPDATTDPV